MKLKVGDQVYILGHNGEKIIREITEVRETGYTWIYPEVPDKDFWSENSCDPFFDLEWKKINT